MSKPPVELRLIPRTLQKEVERVAQQYPVVTLTGPRQSGKTTLAQMALPRHSYVSLENPAARELATSDPLAFLDHHGPRAILDEIQRAPELPSYIQSLVDEDPSPGRFLLTGSQNLAISSSVSQSLAGRTAILELLPLDLEEVRRFAGAGEELWRTVWTGGYPRIYERDLRPEEWLGAYTTTYLERDVRNLLTVGDLTLFQTFLRLCAGRVGQLLNLSSLAADCGVSQPTARRWLSVLEASYVAFRLPPFHANLGKRLTRTPKLYFYDSGLASHLLGIDTPGQMETHPLRGGLFETWVVSEILKQHRHRAKRPNLSFYRERGGLEIDLVIEQGADLTLVEIKSAQTPSARYFAAFERFASRLADRGDARWSIARRLVVYGGDDSQDRRTGRLVSWSDLPATGLWELTSAGE